MTLFSRQLITLLSLALSVFAWVGPVRAVAESLPAATPGLAALVQDPRVRGATLENGVRYAVMSNAEPKGRASLRLLVRAGSLNETGEQRGLAHFIEHMAFNGTEHYPPGSLIEFFQRMGMNFGGDTNAATGFDSTQYQLELASADSATVAEGLRVLADYAGGLLLLPEEIEKERGIIASEKLSRDGVQSRTFEARVKFTLGGTLIPHRLPIGIDEVIQGAQRDRFVAFYDAWYRPENLLVVVVGAVDTGVAEDLVRTAFGSLKPRAPRIPAPALGTPDFSPGLKVAAHHEAEATAVTVSLGAVSPYEERPDSLENRLRVLPA